MDLKKWLPTLISELHAEFLKPIAFRKNGRTVSRDRGSYWERFNFQSSQWNGAGGSWRFYVNVGMEFKDLPPRRRWSYCANTHWACRLEQLVPEAPHQWEFDDATDRAAVKQTLAHLLMQASGTLAGRADALRTEYVAAQ